MSSELEVREAPLTAEALRQQVVLIQEVMKAVMQDGQHYGKIPGCGDKPTLLKPGAEKLSLTFRMAPKYDIETTNYENGHREYEIVCNLFHITTGQFLGSGVGIASTMETKFRYRTQNTGKEVPQGYWGSRDSTLLGGSVFSPRKVDNKWMIFEKIEHDNPSDYYNTIKKMAKKRAHVDAVLTATAASDIFTQDIEEMGELIGQPEKKTKEPIKQPQAKTPPDAPKKSGEMSAKETLIEELNRYVRTDMKQFKIVLKEITAFGENKGTNDMSKVSDKWAGSALRTLRERIKQEVVEGCTLNPDTCDHSEWDKEIPYCPPNKGLRCKYQEGAPF